MIFEFFTGWVAERFSWFISKWDFHLIISFSNFTFRFICNYAQIFKFSGQFQIVNLLASINEMFRLISNSGRQVLYFSSSTVTVQNDGQVTRCFYYNRAYVTWMIMNDGFMSFLYELSCSGFSSTIFIRFTNNNTHWNLAKKSVVTYTYPTICWICLQDWSYNNF